MATQCPPLALYCEVPQYLRDYWHSTSSSVVYTDIFLVEALGPLLLLLAFPKTFRNCMWLHCIDNEAAEASLIRGTSSKNHGDHVVGLTWALIQKLGIFAYFDGDSSKSNPVDGLSRRNFNESPHHKGWQFVCAWTCVREVDAVHFSSSYCGAKRCWEMMGSGPADSFSPLPPSYFVRVYGGGGEGLGLIRRAYEQKKIYVRLTRSHLGLGLVRVNSNFPAPRYLSHGLSRMANMVWAALPRPYHGSPLVWAGPPVAI